MPIYASGFIRAGEGSFALVSFRFNPPRLLLAVLVS